MGCTDQSLAGQGALSIIESPFELDALAVVPERGHSVVLREVRTLDCFSRSAQQVSGLCRITVFESSRANGQLLTGTLRNLYLKRSTGMP